MIDEQPYFFFTESKKLLASLLLACRRNAFEFPRILIERKMPIIPSIQLLTKNTDYQNFFLRSDCQIIEVSINGREKSR